MKFKLLHLYIFIGTAAVTGIIWQLTQPVSRESAFSSSNSAAADALPTGITKAQETHDEPALDETAQDVAGKSFAAAGHAESHFMPAANSTSQVIDASEAGDSSAAGITTLDRESFAALADGKIGEQVSLPLPDGRTVTGTIKLVQNENGTVRVSGALDSEPLSTFVLSASGEHVSGIVQRPAEHLAYAIEETEQGKVVLREKSLSDVVCAPMPRKKDEPARTTGSTGVAGAVAAAVPILNSRPRAVAQLYLDFDGETVTDPLWASGATIVAASYNLSSADITAIFNRVAEDYSSFNINVTTDVQKYNSTAATKRMRCIITPTDTAAPGSGGVAYLGCFAHAGLSGGYFTATIPAWVFNSSVIGISEAISHELGHTFGLHHDGRKLPSGSEEYFAGHGSGATSWGPIMGASYSRSVVQWSKGEYQYASNTENDLAIISGATNGIGSVADEAGASIASATALSLSADSISQTGVIASADADFFSFSTASGVVTINAAGAPLSPDLDIALEIQNASGGVLATSNPASDLTASVSATLAAGTYYLKVNGSGAADPLTSGYSGYASIGVYTLSGTIPGSGTSQSLPNLLPAQPTGWSDKIVVSKTAGTNTDSTPLLPTDALYLDFAVLNGGSAASSAVFATEVYVDNVLAKISQSAASVSVNGYSLVQDLAIGALSVGTHTIRVKVDSGNAVAEGSETDNDFSRTVTISAPTANNNFASAIVLTGNSGSVLGSTIGATAETGEPRHAGYAASKSIWYRWTAPASGTVSIDTFGSNFDTLLAVYVGSSVGTLVSVASNDDAGSDIQSKVTFKVVAGYVYRIAVDGYGGAAGNVTLNYSFAPPVRYTVTATSASTATGVVTTPGGTYNSGARVTVKAVARTGYQFLNWTENGTAVSTSASYTFTINSNRSLVANFVRR